MSVEHDNHEDLNLTPEELEALTLQDDGSDPEPVVDTAESESTEPEGDVAPEPEADEGVVDEEPEAVTAPEPVVEGAFAPEFKVPGVANFEETLAALDAAVEVQIADLAAKYENGDLSFTEYRKQEREVTREYEGQRYALQEQNLKAEIAAEHSRQSLDQKWQLEQNMFYADNEEYKTDPILRGALGAQLEVLYADETNAGKSGLWFLREAGRAVDAKFNRVQAEVPKSDSAKLKLVEDTMKKRATNRPTIPQTLADIPAADENSEMSNEFAYLDKLSGMDYERALSKLSDSQRDRYLAA